MQLIIFIHIVSQVQDHHRLKNFNVTQYCQCKSSVQMQTSPDRKMVVKVAKLSTATIRRVIGTIWWRYALCNYDFSFGIHTIKFFCYESNSYLCCRIESWKSCSKSYGRLKETLWWFLGKGRFCDTFGNVESPTSDRNLAIDRNVLPYSSIDIIWTSIWW